MCTKCSEEFNDKKQIYIHKKSHSQEKLQKKNMKCIVCEFKAETESDLTEHYERKHINDS